LFEPIQQPCYSFFMKYKGERSSSILFQEAIRKEDAQLGNIDYVRRRFARLEAPAQHILELLRPHIVKREYDSVLGDDADGRIQALILSHAIQELYGDKKKLQTVFVQGGSILHEDAPLKRTFSEAKLPLFLQKKLPTGQVTKIHDAENDEDQAEYLWKEPTTHSDEVKAYLKRMKPLLGSKTLLVTEEVFSGSSIDILVDHLHAIGIDVDAASFGVAVDEGIEHNTLLTPKGFPILLGSLHTCSYPAEGYGGVLSRGRSGRGHALPQSFDAHGETRPRINTARKVVKEMGHDLAQRFLANNQTSV